MAKQPQSQSQVSDETYCIDTICQTAFIQVNRRLIKAIGLVEAATLSFLIKQYQFYLETGKLQPDHSFYFAHAKLEEELHLSNHARREVLKVLEYLHLISTERRGYPATTYYHLHFQDVRRYLDDTNQLVDVQQTRKTVRKPRKHGSWLNGDQLNQLDDIQPTKLDDIQPTKLDDVQPTPTYNTKIYTKTHTTKMPDVCVDFEEGFSEEELDAIDAIAEKYDEPYPMLCQVIRRLKTTPAELRKAFEAMEGIPNIRSRVAYCQKFFINGVCTATPPKKNNVTYFYPKAILDRNEEIRKELSKYLHVEPDRQAAAV